MMVVRLTMMVTFDTVTAVVVMSIGVIMIIITTKIIRYIICTP